MSSESTLEKEKDKKLASGSSKLDEPEDDHDEDEEDEDDGDDNEDRGGRSQPPSMPPVGLSGTKVVLDRPSPASVVLTIMRREVSTYLQQATSYIVIAVSLIALGLYFFYYQGGFWQVDRATMARMWEALPYVLCVLTIPLFTMRSLADEKRVGTIELLITMPVRDSEVILGKYFASLTMVTIQIALIALYPIVMFWKPWHIGEFDWNPFWVGMIGLVLLAAAGVAVGMMFSSFTDSQIQSYFGTAVTLTILCSLGKLSLVEFFRGWPGDALAFISLTSRFESFGRGIIDSRAIIYFLSIAVFCLLVAFRSLESRKWS